MIDLNWIIEQENNLTDRARFDLGDNYHLSLDLLKLLQCVKSFSIENEMAHVFDSQILKGFHLVILNTIRRHNVEAQLILRYTLESLVLFVYSMEHIKEKDFKIVRNDFQIIDYDDKLLENAYIHFKKRYPELSKEIQNMKDFINAFYSHSNPMASQYNSAIIDGRLKAFVFDTYENSSIREILLTINFIMIATLKIYKQLKIDYKNMFYFNDNFENQFHELLARHDKLFKDSKENYEAEDYWMDSIKMRKVLNKIDGIKK